MPGPSRPPTCRWSSRPARSKCCAPPHRRGADRYREPPAAGLLGNSGYGNSDHNHSVPGLRLEPAGNRVAGVDLLLAFPAWRCEHRSSVTPPPHHATEEAPQSPRASLSAPPPVDSLKMFNHAATHRVDAASAVTPTAPLVGLRLHRRSVHACGSSSLRPERRRRGCPHCATPEDQAHGPPSHACRSVRLGKVVG